MKTILVFLPIIFCRLFLQNPSLPEEQKEDCDCNEEISWILLEGYGAHQVPCHLPDTINFYSAKKDYEIRYVFLSCNGAVKFQKMGKSGEIIIEGQFIPTDSIVQIYFESIIDDIEYSNTNDTVEYRDAYYARKIGLWIYR